MLLELQYRENDYMNPDDAYICYDGSIMRYLVTKFRFINGSWYSIESLQYKFSTIKIQNSKELYGKRVYMKGLDYVGTIGKVLAPNDIGVIWDSGTQIKKHGLASYWNNWHLLDLQK